MRRTPMGPMSMSLGRILLHVLLQLSWSQRCMSLLPTQPSLIRTTVPIIGTTGPMRPPTSPWVPMDERRTTRRSALSIRRTAALLASPYGIGMDQQDMMNKDMLIAVTSKDGVIPNAQVSKRKAHEFNPEQPRGIVHRAFSVFLFNADHKMLLTRRAKSKITFPGVWTNTCCSHPLHGQTPSEVDDVEGAYPEFPGIKHAAMRKLDHELGIAATDVPHDDFRFLTRFHYWASDTVTYGRESPWGEHEIDYVLFIQCKEDPTVDANIEEVDEIKYVSLDELKELMYKDNDNDNGETVLWSPWFRGIMEQGGFELWENLEDALKVDSNWINKDIVFFDPPAEHCAAYNLPHHGRGTGVLEFAPDVPV